MGQSEIVAWYMGAPKRKRNSDDQITYSSRNSDGFQVLSNFYYSPFEVDGLRFTSVEDYFHWSKTKNAFFVNRPLDGELTNDKDLKKHGVAALKMARTLGGSFPPGWHASEPFQDGVSFDVMKRGMLAKFQQNERLRAVLLETGSTPLLHTDRFFYTKIFEQTINGGIRPKTIKGSYGKFYWACMKPADASKSLQEVFLAAHEKDGKADLGRRAWDIIETNGGVQCEHWIGLNRTGRALMDVRSMLF